MSSTVYGLVAEFDDADAILDAADKIRDAGYRVVEAYTPFPVHGLAEKIAKEDIRVPWLMFGCGIMGLCVAYGLEWSTNSPPLHCNFAVIPTVESRRPLWDLKHPDDPDSHYE